MTRNRHDKLTSKLVITSLSVVSLLIAAEPDLRAEEKPITAAAEQILPAPKNDLRTFSLAKSFEIANQHSKEIIAAKYNLPIAKAGIEIAAAIPNPRFNLLYGWGPAYSIIIAGNPQQFGFQQQLQTAGKRSKQIAVARANYKVAEDQYASLVFDVHNRVRRAYAELAAAEAYVNLLESQRKVAEQLYQTAEKRFQAGKGSKSDSLHAELGVTQFDTSRTQAQTRLQKASAALSFIIGETPQSVEIIDVDDNGIFKLSAEETDLVPSASRALPKLAELLPEGFLHRPDLKVAIEQSNADQKSLDLAKAQRIPDIYLDSGYQFTTFKKNQPYALANGQVPNSPGCYMNITMEHPIYYQKQGEIAQAKGTLNQDYDEVEQLKSQIACDIVSAYESVTVARANIIKFQSQIIPQATEVSQMAVKRYQIGKAALSSAILAKRQYQQVLSSYFDSV
ncbi:MAG: TolC family protein, partial [Candidatus Obscuribacterales bacterium]|nr:TolC family protein [Candidatus Obscuribacterales bacterium]